MADNLFANWSHMQANKATPELMDELRQWLENPKSNAGAAVNGAKDDLSWLNQQKDLSSVVLGEKGTPDTKEKASTASPKSGGGFAALFGCASKRK